MIMMIDDRDGLIRFRSIDAVWFNWFGLIQSDSIRSVATKKKSCIITEVAYLCGLGAMQGEEPAEGNAKSSFLNNIHMGQEKEICF